MQAFSFPTSLMDITTLNVIHMAPTITASGSATFGTGLGPVVLDNTVTVADPNSGGLLTGATITISGGTLIDDGDILAANTTGTAITAIFDSGTETLTLTGSDTLADTKPCCGRSPSTRSPRTRPAAARS